MKKSAFENREIYIDPSIRNHDAGFERASRWARAGRS